MNNKSKFFLELADLIDRHECTLGDVFNAVIEEESSINTSSEIRKLYAPVDHKFRPDGGFRGTTIERGIINSGNVCGYPGEVPGCQAKSMILNNKINFAAAVRVERKP